MDFIAEVILEVFVAVYIEIMTAFLPERKLKKWQIKMIAGTEAVVLLLLAIVGAVMLAETDCQSVAGKVMLGVSLSVILLQITFGIIIRIRKK